MYDHLLLAAAIVLGLTLLRLLRRPGGAPVLYTLVIAAELGAALVGMGQGGRVWGNVAIALCGLTVVAPALLESLAKILFARGAMSAAVRAAGLRAMLMPGSGLARHQQILEGLALLDRDGVDAAIAHFRRLLRDTDDPQEALVIHEQIVSMLFYGQRWGEAISHYEGQFHLGHAALRPSLALGLLRAYGEAGELERAAGLLRALEEGPLGADPAAVDLLGQARFTFLAYSGQARLVDEAVAAGRAGAFGLSPASTALFHGIALARAGEPDRAVVELERACALAGPKDARVVAASRSALARVGEAAAPLAPELRRYALAVGERLRVVLRAGPVAARRGVLVATHGVVAAMIAGFVVVLVRGGGGLGLLEVGAFAPALWAAGSWGRVFTAPFVHADLIALVIDLYAIWLGGHVVERSLGSARMLLVAVGGAAAGLWASGQVIPEPLVVIGGGPAMATAVLVAALWTLAPMRMPAITARARRSLMLTLLLLLLAQLLACLPALVGLAAPPVSLAAAALVGTLLGVGLPRALPSIVRRALGVLALAGALGAAVGVAQVAGEDITAYLEARRDVEVREGGVRLGVPASFVRQEAGEALGPGVLPRYAGLRDAVALRGGELVQLVVVDVAGSGLADDAAAIFAVDPALAHEVTLRHDEAAPPALAAALDATGAPWRAYTLVRDGEVLAAVVERALGPRRVVLIASPASALAGSPVLYARILADAAIDSEGPRAGADGDAVTSAR